MSFKQKKTIAIDETVGIREKPENRCNFLGTLGKIYRRASSECDETFPLPTNPEYRAVAIANLRIVKNVATRQIRMLGSLPQPNSNREYRRLGGHIYDAGWVSGLVDNTLKTTGKEINISATYLLPELM